MTTLPEQEAKIRTTPEPPTSMINIWFDLLLKNDMIFVLRDKREQLGITEDELGLPVRDATLKTGDYHVIVKNTKARFVIERKADDLYSTLFGQRERFHKEIKRFQADSTLDSFIILCEWSRQEFLDYVPDRKSCQYCKCWTRNRGGVKDVGVCNCDDVVQLKGEHESCAVFDDKETEEDRRSQILNSKKATINSLNVRPGVQVIFSGSRADMVEQFRDMIRQWVLQNWKLILGDEDDN